MKTLSILFFAFLLGSSTPIEVKTTKEATVYICTGSKANKYHKTDRCRGLNRCSGSIKQLSISSAKSKGFSPCKICYN